MMDTNTTLDGTGEQGLPAGLAGRHHLSLLLPHVARADKGELGQYVRDGVVFRVFLHHVGRLLLIVVVLRPFLFEIGFLLLLRCFLCGLLSFHIRLVVGELIRLTVQLLRVLELLDDILDQIIAVFTFEAEHNGRTHVTCLQLTQDVNDVGYNEFFGVWEVGGRRCLLCGGRLAVIIALCR
ncbi:hypothetical protein AGDE_16342 [Angomonas deanei]|nr:hypothetical protein AGDE_16342 [Angomonas deanei]|eukprot:EPY17278.1 hypothetical protein AGDE_16342 [Angomonas deanei]